MELSKKSLFPILWVAIIGFFSWLMFQVILPYSTWEWNVDFLETKQLIIHLDHYRFSFYAHISSSLIILFSGAFLFVDVLLKKQPKIHRWINITLDVIDNLF